MKQPRDGRDGLDGAPGRDGAPGKPGKDGTTGKDGRDGRTAFELAKDLGFEGSLDDWLKSLRGQDGSDGKDGADGLDGKDGRNGLNGLNGAAGENGKDGAQGPVGPRGPQGPEGPQGPMPEHYWEGTRLHFQNPNGLFDAGVDLQGPPGKAAKPSGGAGDLNVVEEAPKDGTIYGRKNGAWTSVGTGGDQFVQFDQSTPSSTWVITHNMNKYPSVTVVDSGGSPAVGTVTYNSQTQLTVDFDGSSFSGKAYLN